MWTKCRWLLAILVVALVAAACGDDDVPAAPDTTAAATTIAALGPATGEPYVVGVSSDFTGFGASNYAALADSMRIYFEALNDAGGIDGHPVELIIRDNKSDPAIVTSDMKFFDQEGTTAVYYNGFSSTIAAATSAASAGTPILYGNACYPPAPPPDVRPNFFCAGISPVGEGRALVDLLLTKQDASEIKLGLLPSDLPGTRFAHGVVIGPYAESLGIDVVDTQIIPMSVTDLTAAARRFVDKGVNAVISYSAPSHVIGIAEALHKLGWDGTMISVSYSPGNIESMERVLSPSWFAVDKYALSTDDYPIVRQMAEAADKYGAEFELPSLRWGWADAMVMHRMLQACGFPCERDQLLQVMDNLRIDDQDWLDFFGSPLVWSPDNHSSPEKAFRLYRLDEATGHLVLDQDWTLVAEPGMSVE
jgi:branched-chain amino acid transport system substrate-binding protein